MKRISLSTLIFLAAYGLYIIRAGIESTTFMAFFNDYSITRPITFILGVLLIGTKVVLCDKKINKKAIRYLFVIAILFVVEFCYTSYFELLYLLLLMIGLKNIELKDVVKAHFCVYSAITVIAILSSWIDIIENYFTVTSSGIIRYAWGNTYPTDFAAGIFYLLLDYIYLNYKKLNVFRYIVLTMIVISSYLVTYSKTSLILELLLLFLLLISKSRKITKSLTSNLYQNIVAFSFPVLAVITIYIQYIFKNNGYNNPIFFALNIMMNYRLGLGSRAIQQYGLSLFGKRIKFYGAGWGTSNTEMYFFVDNGYLQYALLYGLLLTAIFIIGYYLFCRYSKYFYNQIGLIIALTCISISAISEPRIFNILYNPFFLGTGILLWKIPGITKK